MKAKGLNLGPKSNLSKKPINNNDIAHKLSVIRITIEKKSTKKATNLAAYSLTGFGNSKKCFNLKLLY
tara:strand:- start:263 stop:466 length:204 start_codon:yes stop_codon:yes gene_type:complete